MADAKKSNLNPGANAFTPGGVGPQREQQQQQYTPANVPVPSFRGTPSSSQAPRPGFPPMHHNHHHHHAAYAAPSGYRPANVQVGSGAPYGMPQYPNSHAHLGNGAPQSLGGGGPMGGPFHHHANHGPLPHNAHHHHLHHHHHPQHHVGYPVPPVPHTPGPQFNPPPGPSQHIAPVHVNPHALAAHHHHHLAHHTLHHHNFIPPHAAQSNPVIDRNLMKPPAAQPSIPNVILCVANQTFEDMKSEFCKQLAASKGAIHIVLEDHYNQETSVVEVSRLEQLERELDDVLAAVPTGGATAPTLIIENAASRSKHEIFYVDDLLRRKKFCLHTIVLFAELGGGRDNVDESATDFVKHPIGFEICSRHIDGGRLCLIDTPASVEESMQFFLKDQGDRMSAKTEVLPEALAYPEEELPCSHVVMEANLRTALTVLKSATAALGVKDIFTPLGVSPARVLDYSHFTKRSHFLRSYKATLLYDGERVSVVGHQNHVYILTGATGIVYRFDDEAVIPACLRKLLAEKPSTSTDGSALRFVFSATICAQSNPKRHTILLSDVLFLNGVAGNKMYLAERLDALRGVFADESSSPQRSTAALTIFVPQTYFDVEYIGQHINKEDPLVQGVCLVHPGYCLSGTYDRLNYIWWLPEPRHLEVRLWGGALKTTVNNSQMWFFDAMVLDADGCMEEKLLNLQVVIPDKIVEEQCINDGNIVDVMYTQDVSIAGSKMKPAKGLVAMPSQRLSFVRRKLWTIFPLSKVFVDAILNPSGRWSKESLVRSTSFLTSLKMERPVETEALKPEFAE